MEEKAGSSRKAKKRRSRSGMEEKKEVLEKQWKREAQGKPWKREAREKQGKVETQWKRYVQGTKEERNT